MSLGGQCVSLSFAPWTAPARADASLNCGDTLALPLGQGWSGPGRPVWTLADARSRFGGLVPGITSLSRYFLRSCFSSAPLISVMRLRLAQLLAGPAEPRCGDQYAGCGVVVGHYAGQGMHGKPDQAGPSLGLYQAYATENRCLLVATASTPPSLDGIALHDWAAIAADELLARCSYFVGVRFSRFAEIETSITSMSSVKRNRSRSERDERLDGLQVVRVGQPMRGLE